MKVVFDTKDRTKILDDIKEAMGGRSLAEIVDFSMTSNQLVVTISKMGTSKLEFSESETDSGYTYTLTKEKIALTHKAFKDEVTKKILSVVEKAGGKIS